MTILQRSCISMMIVNISSTIWRNLALITRISIEGGKFPTLSAPTRQPQKLKCSSISEYTQGVSSAHSVVAHSLLYLTCFIMNMMNILLLSAHSVTWCITPWTLCVSIKLENMAKAMSVRCVIDVLIPQSNAWVTRKNDTLNNCFAILFQKSFLYVTTWSHLLFILAFLVGAYISMFRILFDMVCLE